MVTLLDDERLLDLELGDLRRRLVLLSDELLRLLRRLDGGEGDLLLELLERVRRRRLLSSDVDLDFVRRLTNVEFELVRRTADLDLERLRRRPSTDGDRLLLTSLAVVFALYTPPKPFRTWNGACASLCPSNNTQENGACMYCGKMPFGRKTSWQAVYLDSLSAT